MEAGRRLLTAMARPFASLELTEKEIDCLRLLADGLHAGQVAQRLFISEDTVRYRLQRAYIKLGARNMTHAVALAWKAGLIE